MHRLVAVFLLTLGGIVAQAEPFPALYDVRGVADDDVLFIREAPSSAGAIIDRFRPEETGIEVVRAQGNWARVRVGESMGWASLRFLVRQQGQGLSEVPPELFCGGTEPFWTLDIERDKGGAYPGEFLYPGVFEGPQRVHLEALRPAPNDLRQLGGFGVRGPSGDPFTLGIKRQLCSDGMSDIEYGFTALVIARFGEAMQALGGCCSLR
ncbi:MAG: hypothetical protein AAGA47_00015 [Pseudomonadota bacterium]